MGRRRLIAIVDDDESVREALPDLLRELGYEAQAFCSAADFLASDTLTAADGLILDVAMPSMSGPELQLELTRRGVSVPIVFITAHADAAIGPRVLERGAAALLFKPFSPGQLLAPLEAAFARAG